MELDAPGSTAASLLGVHLLPLPLPLPSLAPSIQLRQRRLLPPRASREGGSSWETGETNRMKQMKEGEGKGVRRLTSTSALASTAGPAGAPPGARQGGRRLLERSREGRAPLQQKEEGRRYQDNAVRVMELGKGNTVILHLQVSTCPAMKGARGD